MFLSLRVLKSISKSSFYVYAIHGFIQGDAYFSSTLFIYFLGISKVLDSWVLIIHYSIICCIILVTGWPNHLKGMNLLFFEIKISNDQRQLFLHFFCHKSQFFCELRPLEKFQNPLTIPSGKEWEKTCNNKISFPSLLPFEIFKFVMIWLEINCFNIFFCNHGVFYKAYKKHKFLF